MAATLSRTRFNGYSDAVDALAEEAYGKAMAAIASLDIGSLNPEDLQALADMLERAADIIAALTDEYGDGAAYLAANLYDGIVAELGTGAQSALMAEGESGESIGKSVGGWQRYLEEGDPGAFSSAVANYVKASVRSRANDTMMQNVRRDRRRGMGYALVPASADPCEWCCMLISRGFVYASETTAGASQHTNCKCKVIPGRNGLEVEGFDLGYYEDLWAESAKAVPHDEAYGDYSAMSSEERKEGGYKSFNDFLTKRQLAAMRQLRKGGGYEL